MPTCYQTAAAAAAAMMKMGNAPQLLCNNTESHSDINIPSRNAPVWASLNNSPRCQRAPPCRPTYGPWWWHVVRGAWPVVCAPGPTCWCQESLGLQDAARLQKQLALGLALPWCTVMLTALPAKQPTEQSQGDKCIYVRSVTAVSVNRKKTSHPFWQVINQIIHFSSRLFKNFSFWTVQICCFTLLYGGERRVWGLKREEATGRWHFGFCDIVPVIIKSCG